MPIKTVFTVIGVDQSDKDLEAALSLCEEIEAHLSVFVVGIAAPPPIGEYAVYISDSWYKERENDQARLQKYIKHVNEIVVKRSVSADVDNGYVEESWLEGVIGRRAIYADLTLVGAGLADNATLKDSVLNGALFESRRPVLLSPKGSKVTLSPKRVLVAWDSRVEASRAVSEAIEVLKTADEVHVTIVDPDTAENKSGAEPGADVATYLARHRVKVIVDRLPRMGLSTADVLKKHAVDISADFIVMGAYGHSRLRERIFGGVTKSMLDKPPLPILLAR
jgi:nucleotide-binding universal stress UspA family protein